MRIVQYYPRAIAGDGGMTRAVQKLSISMTRAGAEAVIAYDAGTGSAQPVDCLTWRSVRHRGPEKQRVPDGGELADVLRDADLVVLNSGFAPHNVLAARIARRHGVAYIVAPRGAYDPQIFLRRRHVKKLWWRFFEGPMVKRACAVHIFFPEETADLEQLGYSGPTLIAPNGVEPPPGMQWDGGTGGYLLWLGRFDPQHKGLDLLVRALARVPRENRPSLRLVGPDWRDGRERVLALVGELDLGKWVSVEPPLYGDEKWAALRSATGFVYPSRWEGFGNSVAEAASVGLPLLVTPYPFGRLLHRRGGAVLASATVEGLAEGLQTVSAADAATLGARAQQVVLEEMSWDAIGRSWLSQAEALL
jgi:glycosyltransferase involved in cell wall biosynthesis